MTRKAMGGWLGTLLLLLAPAKGRGLTLEEALALADSTAFPNRLARQASDEIRGQEISSMAGFLPVLRAEVGGAVTDDPLGAFATRLGQRRVSMRSFDPAKLNAPEVIGGWNAALVAEVPLMNVDAWKGRAAAGKAAQARILQIEAVRRQMHGRVVESWHAVGLAREAVATWEAALVAAEGHLKRAQSVQRNGMANRSDVLAAQVRCGEIEASLRQARADEVLARANLAFLLGGFAVEGMAVGAPASDSQLHAFASSLPAQGRSVATDVVAVQAEAARADLERSRSAFLPRLDGQARMDWKGNETLWQEDAAWSVGVLASWTLFRGGDDWGQERSARARLAQARTGLAAQVAQERLEGRSLRARFEAALDRTALADRNLESAAEAHRISARRYEEGMAEIVELFEAQAMETRLRLARAAARQEAIAALSGLALLQGRDPADLATLTR